MNTLTVSSEIFGYGITAQARKIGPDWLVTVTGGCRPHIGSTTIAEFRGGSAVLQTIIRATHRDNVVGELFARRICEQEKTSVCVNCGIHYNGVSKEEIRQIVNVCEGLLHQLCGMIAEFKTE